MKRERAARMALGIFFLGVLVTPSRPGEPFLGRPRLRGRLYANASIERHGFHLTESRIGRNQLHPSRSLLDSKLATIMPQVASMGASVSIVDFDRDGWHDIYVTTVPKAQERPLSQSA